MGSKESEDVQALKRWCQNLQLHIEDKNYKAAWSDSIEINKHLKRINVPEVYARKGE